MTGTAQNFAPAGGSKGFATNQYENGSVNIQLNNLKMQSNKPQIEKVNFPLIKDYEIIFHEQEVYKVSLNADLSMLQIVLIS